MSRDDFYVSPFGIAHSTYMERPRLSRLIGRVLWGGDSKPCYDSMSAIEEVAGGDNRRLPMWRGSGAVFPGRGPLRACRRPR